MLKVRHITRPGPSDGSPTSGGADPSPLDQLRARRRDPAGTVRVPAARPRRVAEIGRRRFGGLAAHAAMRWLEGPGSAGRRTRPPARAATLRPAPPRRALHRARRGRLARVEHWRGFASGIAADLLANPICRPGPRPIRPPAMKCHAAAPFWPDSAAVGRTQAPRFAVRGRFLPAQAAIAPSSMSTR